jgi:N-acetylglucosamine-6-sulfatase
MRHARTARHLVLVGVAVAALLVTLIPWVASTPVKAEAAGRPNIVLITTDDMAASDMAWMPRTRELLQQQGVEITDFLSNHPLCCPARALILTGQHAHNNGVHSNAGKYGGYHSLIDKGNHIGTWLKSSGYRTAFIGKHLNHWPESGHHQPGWTDFNPFYKGGYKPYGITMFNNGRPKHYAGTYTADLVGRLTVESIKRYSSSGAPFFIWASQLPPHKMRVDGHWSNPVPAARHRDLYPTSLPAAMSSPSYKEADVSDKPPFVQAKRGVSNKKVTALHRARIRSLRAVDDQVGAIVRALRDSGELANTYVVFTSDNGYLLGEHRLQGKNFAYEESLQVPLLVRGPGLDAGARRDQMYGLVDLAPTLLDIAGASPQRKVDGRSMLPTLRRNAPGYDRYLIQAAQDGRPWWWRGVRTRQHTYVEFTTGFRELYDRAQDPAQLDNVAGDPGSAEQRAALAAQLAALRSCSGAACHTGAAAE